jgi:hypothetical protein
VGAFLFFLVFAAVVLVAVGGALGTYVGGQRFRSLKDFVEKVSVASGLSGSPREFGLFDGLDSVRFLGVVSTLREASVTYTRHSTGKTFYYKVHIAVRADPAVRLELTREGLLERVGEWLGFVKDAHVGDESFDRKFWIKTSNENRTKRAMDTGLRAIVERLFQERELERLEVKDGWLRIDASDGAINPFDYKRVLEQLDAAARTFDRVELDVHVLGAKRRAFRDEHGGTRCAYCHGGISGAEADLVACDRCHTVLHDECWRELGRCPLLGCGSQTVERARVA